MYIKKHHIKIHVRALLAIILLLSVVIACSSSVYADTLAELNQKYDKLQQAKKDLQAQEDNNNSAQQSTQDKIALIQKKIKTSLQLIEINNEKLTEINSQIAAIEASIAQTQQSITDNMELYKQRLKAQYEAGKGSYIEVLLSSGDFSDLLVRAQLLISLSSYEKKIYDTLESEMASLVSKQADLQSQKASRDSEKADLEANQQDYNSDLKKQSEYFQELQAKGDSITEQEKQIDAQLDAVDKQRAQQRLIELGGAGTSTNAVVQYAENYIGYPYVWGTAGPNTFDCSGFTQWVYAYFGYFLPHHAADQATYGSSVSKANLKAGDLVFFKNTGGRSGITHVGIYIGEGEFINALNSDVGVVISDLNSSYFSSHYSCARRIIN